MELTHHLPCLNRFFETPFFQTFAVLLKDPLFMNSFKGEEHEKVFLLKPLYSPSYFRRMLEVFICLKVMIIIYTSSNNINPSPQNEENQRCDVPRQLGGSPVPPTPQTMAPRNLLPPKKNPSVCPDTFRWHDDFRLTKTTRTRWDVSWFFFVGMLQLDDGSCPTAEVTKWLNLLWMSRWKLG